jgi:hypothetical protein
MSFYSRYVLCEWSVLCCLLWQRIGLLGTMRTIFVQEAYVRSIMHSELINKRADLLIAVTLT